MSEQITDILNKIKKLRKLMGDKDTHIPTLSSRSQGYAEVYQNDAKYYRLDYIGDKISGSKSEISKKEFLSNIKRLHKCLLEEARVFMERKLIREMVDKALREYI